MGGCSLWAAAVCVDFQFSPAPEAPPCAWPRGGQRPCRARRQKRRLAAEDEVLDLHAGKGVDVVERLIPDVEVSALAQAQGQQRLFLLPVAEFFGVGFQMGAGKAQFAQYGEKLRHIRAALPGQRAQIAAQEGGVLGDDGNAQAAAAPDAARVRRHFARQKPQRRGLAAAVAAQQRHALAAQYGQADAPQRRAAIKAHAGRFPDRRGARHDRARGAGALRRPRPRGAKAGSSVRRPPRGGARCPWRA